MPRGRIANTIESFKKYVDPSKDGCWIWKGTKHYKGYGVFVMNKNIFQAHRVSYFLANPGSIEMRAPSDKASNLFVLHRCDVRACVNPSHLFLGSIADNSDDMIKKGRAGKRLFGEDNPMSRFTLKQVRDIRRMLADRKLSQTEIANKYGVTQATISRIKLGAVYKGVA